MENRINVTLSQTNIDAVESALDALHSNLPFLVDLSIEERQSLPKMGTRSQEFVRSAATVAEQNTGILPRNFDPIELRTDVVLYDQIAGVLLKVEKLRELLDDTLMLVGSEAMAGALIVYNSARLHGKGEALDGALDDLAKRFKRRSAAETAEPATAA